MTSDKYYAILILSKGKAKVKNMDNETLTLTSRICDCISDGYDDEELREDAENDLYGELEEATDFIAKVLERLCERIEDLEE